MEKRPASGIYNLGTGKARTFADLGKAVFDAMQIPINIEYIPMPEDIRHSYQYYTQAEMNKLRTVGQYTHDFISLEEGIKTYIQQHLIPLYNH
jgi:ADP-L-glycero-D-manno-heptose 6-epimerase